MREDINSSNKISSPKKPRLFQKTNHQEYSFSSSSAKLFLTTSLLSFRAAVTRPDSGVQGSASTLIFAGISNFSNLAVFASCNVQNSTSLTLLVYECGSLIDIIPEVTRSRFPSESLLFHTILQNQSI